MFSCFITSINPSESTVYVHDHIGLSLPIAVLRGLNKAPLEHGSVVNWKVGEADYGAGAAPEHHVLPLTALA